MTSPGKPGRTAEALAWPRRQTRPGARGDYVADDDVYQELPETPSQPQWDPPAAAGDDDLPDR